ncbi:MAG: calcineurin-like phosphoesterase family protein [Bacteroidales bacterium]|nr:calcineurin-like phosphoesterase family protein [Bacteroidales bacterium]
MKRFFILTISAIALAAPVSCNRIENRIPESEVTVLEIAAPGPVSRTVLGPSVNDKRSVYWTDGDCLSLNGTASNPLTGVAAEQASATFTFPGVISAPYRILYPASFFNNSTTVTLPSTQEYVAGSFAPDTAPLAGYSESGSGSISLGHLESIIHLAVKKDAGVSASNLVSVRFTGNAGEQVCGDFTINYETPSLTGAAEAGVGRELTLEIGQPLSESTALDLFLVVPAGEYASGFTVVLEDAMHRTMTKVKDDAITLQAGKLKKMTAFNFVPSALASPITIEDITEEVLVPDGYNVTGRVVDTGGNGLAGVVVSDGTQCVRTMFDGSFYMTSDIENVKFVHVSTPSGYMPQVVGGIPKFYKKKADITPSAGVYDFGDYELTAVANPDRYTLLITADPQPRKYSAWNNDRIAFRSLDVCEDLYDELADVAAGITGRQVYGICLGDVVHEDMSLFANYNAGLARLGYPTYNIIGNHDNDPSGANDDEGAAPFESYYGPRNYSFNIGGIHYVMLDNLVMSRDPGNDNKLTYFEQGLSDGIWAWLQADLAMIPTSTKLMVCAHSPMFKLISGAERSKDEKALHGTAYGDLINDYTEVHAWAGHTHVGFNYNYPSNHRHKKVQVHTLARSTGELWTNEYLAAGTPRGFTIVEVDNGNISWRFHPLTRQTGDFVGVSSGICLAGAPDYDWRDWDYDGSGVAVMRGGGSLTEDYQIHVYPRGAYGDNYVYANVFLWDDKWQTPVWTPDGGAPVAMTLLHDTEGSYILDTEKIHDLANTEIRTHYKANVGFFVNDDGYTASEVGSIATLFRAPADASPAGGTVSVTDRFGNNYSRHVSW